MNSETNEVDYDQETPEARQFMKKIDDSDVDLDTIESRLQDLECERNSARKQRDAALAREQALKFDLETRELQIKTITAWLDAKIAEQEAEDAKAKACEWVDYPLFKRVVLPVPSVRYDCSDLYISDIQTHPNFAGIVDNYGVVYASWDDWVFAKKEWNPTARGFRIPTPKAVRMWREGTVPK